MNKIAVLVGAALMSLSVQSVGVQSVDETTTQNMSNDTMDGMDHSTMGMDHGAMQGMDHSTMQETPKDMDHDMNHDHGANGESAMDHENMPGMDHGSMPGMDHGTMQGMDHGAMSGSSKTMDHNMNHDAAAMSGGGMAGMNHGSMQGGAAPADARDPHAYADGYDFGPIPRPRLGDEHNFGSLLVDRLEAVRTSDKTSAAYDLLAWYGRDYNRAVLKAEGDVDNGELAEARTELLWGHAVAAYWNTQLGLRYDSGEGPDRTWLALGIQGLAPYWFETDATAYVGNDGRTALNVEAEYELLFTQKLILQPRFEADLYGKDDARRGLGSGLSELSAGLRLRYEIRREFAPYIGVEWAGKFGGTADYARAAGLDTKETRAVAGVRLWF